MTFLREWAVWGFVATVVLTTVLAGTQGLGLTRMSLPFLLGTLVTSDRDRAKVAGVTIHLVNGWVLALIYLSVFRVLGGGGIARGALIGAVHALFVLTVVLPVLPGIDPRMAGQHRGPTAPRQLEPPGFLALHYGWSTAAVLVAAHVVFGLLLAVGAGVRR